MRVAARKLDRIADQHPLLHDDARTDPPGQPGLKHEALAGLKLAVGDRVTCAWDNRDPGSWTIAAIQERRSKLAELAGLSSKVIGGDIGGG